MRMRALGLMAAEQRLEGLAPHFTLDVADLPDEPEDSQAGHDLPDEVMRVPCDGLDLLESMASAEVRAAAEVMIDTGRRPAEVCQLAPARNPDGRWAIAGITEQHRNWVRVLPEMIVPVTVDGGGQAVRQLLPFDKAKAYRHTCAQRHADVGVEVDVLRQLMDHQVLSTTQRYYQVRDEPQRKVTRLEQAQYRLAGAIRAPARDGGDCRPCLSQLLA